MLHTQKQYLLSVKDHPDLLSLNADKGLKEGLRFGARTKTLLELCERGFQM